MTAEAEDLPDLDPVDADAPRPPIARYRQKRWWLGGIALLILVALLAAWIERKPIAGNYIDATLAKDNVPARYHIADLGLGRQRLTDLVIGDPAHPDLVADWVEVNTVIGLHGVHVTGVRAGRVRLRGKLIDGHVSLGAIDRLLPAPSGKPFALPAIDLAVQDGRMRLETPEGLVGLKLSGSGLLTNGFSGQVAAVSSRLDLGNCVASRVAGTATLTVADSRPTLSGPVRAAALQCGGNRLASPVADLTVTLGDRLDRWRGKAKLAVARLDSAAGHIEKLGGAVDFEGSPAQTKGSLDLTGASFGAASVTGGALDLAGSYRLEPGFIGFQGSAAAKKVALSSGWIARIADFGGSGRGTPFGPLAAKLAKAGMTAARSLSVDANIDALRAGAVGRIGVSRLILGSASGARATLSGGDGVQYGWPNGGVRIDGLLALSGGELPEAAIHLAQAKAGGPMTGTAIVRPYAAGDARLALTPVSFTARPGGATRFSTIVTLSGPLGDGGRLDKGRLAVTGLWNGAERVEINTACAPLSFDRLAVSGLVLNEARLRICPAGGALVRIDGTRIDGGARIAAPHLTGALGGTPLTLAATSATLGFKDRGFTLAGLEVRLGQPEQVTALDFGALDGHLDGAAVAGTFADTKGQIANVPLLMSDAAGDWTLNGGVLDVTGGLTVADAAPQPRFEPLDSKRLTLRLANNTITASGTLDNPATGVKVTDVSIEHDLSRGAGHADLAVPGITFGKALQPEQLTRLTYGVIADVDGTVSGEGHIRWSSHGVTSDGVFKTTGTNLAAAFGPVTGISTEIHFTDLLNMVSAPDQTATVAEINPGVLVDNGVIHYQTLSSTQVKVDGAAWPFSGGQLTLDPTVLDFSEGNSRRLTFRVKSMNAGQFLQQFDFKNINATGTFDGVLPMVFGADGGRVENGRLTVRAGGGTIAYVGDLTQKDLGTWGNMAFQALKSLKYDHLTITMNGPLAGEMVTKVRFGGVRQGKGTKTNFLVKRLIRLPFVFNVTIRAPFRQLISSAESFYDPSHLPQGKVQELIGREERPDQPAPQPEPSIQPPESETVP